MKTFNQITIENLPNLGTMEIYDLRSAVNAEIIRKSRGDMCWQYWDDEQKAKYESNILDTFIDLTKRSNEKTT